MADIAAIASQVMASRVTQILLIFIYVLLILGVLSLIFFYFYRKYKMYNIDVRLYAKGANEAHMAGKDRARIRPKHNDMRLYKLRLTLPLPPRKYLVPLEKGGWHIVVYKFGAKDFTYNEVNVNEAGVNLKATDSYTRKWAALEFTEKQQKLLKLKWYEQPLVMILVIGVIMILALWVTLGKMGDVAGVCGAVSSACASVSGDLANCVQQAGQFYQG